MSWFNRRPNIHEIKRRNARKRASPTSERLLRETKEQTKPSTPPEKPNDK